MKFRFVVFLVDLASRRGCTGAGVGLSFGGGYLYQVFLCAQTYSQEPRSSLRTCSSSNHDWAGLMRPGTGGQYVPYTMLRFFICNCRSGVRRHLPVAWGCCDQPARAGKTQCPNVAAGGPDS